MPRPLSVPLALITHPRRYAAALRAGAATSPEERERAAARQAALAAGTFVAERIDREPLPQTDEVVDDEGTTYIIEFDRLVLSLRDDRRFRASVRYRRTLYSADRAAAAAAFRCRR